MNRIPLAEGETNSDVEYAATNSPNNDHTLATLRAGVHPLQIIRPQSHPSVDLGIGYTAEYISATRGTIQGPYVQADHYAWVRTDGRWTKRVGLRASAELLHANSADEPGVGATLALSFELGSFAEGLFAAVDRDSLVAGAAYGEGAIGGYFGASYRAFDQEAYWFPSLGLYGRIPAAVGIICCMKLR